MKLADAYEAGPPSSFEPIQARFATLHRETGKQLWPWVFVNRMIGSGGSNALANKPEFQKINAVDIDDSAGAQEAFLDYWRFALRQAKTSKVPGVVLDMEFYNDYAAYSVANVARERSVAVNEVEAQLHQIGDRMAQTAREEYRDATVWILNAGLSASNLPTRAQENQDTRSFMLHGLLDGARKRHLGLVLVDGGEDSLGYCHRSAIALRDAIQLRLQQDEPLLRAYRGAVQLGGTIALWGDSASRTGWLRDGNCAITDVRGPGDFIPYLKLLFENYRFVWVYAPVVGRYDPFDPGSSEPMDEVLRQARMSVH